MKRDFYLEIKSGKLIDNRKSVATYLGSRRDGKCKITVATGVDVDDPKRTSNQNRYYWGIVIARYLNAMLDTGDNSVEQVRMELHLETLADALHEMLLYRFAGCELVDYDTGEVMRIPMRTSQMNTKQIGVFWDKVREDCKERYGDEIPPPPSDVFEGLEEPDYY